MSGYGLVHGSLDSFKQKLKFYRFNSCFNVWPVYVCVTLIVMLYRPGLSLLMGH